MSGFEFSWIDGSVLVIDQGKTQGERGCPSIISKSENAMPLGTGRFPESPD
jgi:hypothetical protein